MRGYHHYNDQQLTTCACAVMTEHVQIVSCCSVTNHIYNTRHYTNFLPVER